MSEVEHDFTFEAQPPTRRHLCDKRPRRRGRSSTSKRIRETEAEAVAFIVCSAIGLETGSASRGYIGLYGGNAKLLGESLEYVQRTATQILNAIGADDSSAPPA